VLFGAGSDSGAAYARQRQPFRELAGDAAHSTSAPRIVDSLSVAARVMDRPGASAASRTLHHEEL